MVDVNKIIGKVLGRVTENERQAYVMRKALDASYSDIADMLEGEWHREWTAEYYVKRVQSIIDHCVSRGRGDLWFPRVGKMTLRKEDQQKLEKRMLEATGKNYPETKPAKTTPNVVTEKTTPNGNA